MKILSHGFAFLVSLGLIFQWNQSHAQVPSAPVSFYVVSTNGSNELHWDANPGGEAVTSYQIYRGLNKTTFSLINTSTALQFTDNSVDNGKLYFYKITAVNASGEGMASLMDAGVPEDKFGKFLRMNGTDSDTVWINNSDELQLNVPNGSSFSIEFWMRVVELPLPGNEGYIIGRYTNTNLMRYVVRLRETGKLEFHTSNLTSGIVSNATIQTNKWYHIAVTYTRNGTTPINAAKLYINGALDKSSSTMQSLFSSVAGKLIIGGDPLATNRFFNGYLDEMRMWSSLRTQPEINDNKCVHMRGDEAGLVALWHFDETGNTSIPMIYDYHKNGNNGGDKVTTMTFTPHGNDDSSVIPHNTTTVVKVQKNDVGYSNTKLITNSLLSGYPLNGTAAIINSDSISYTPDSGFSGIDTVKYVLADTASFCNSLPQYDTAVVILQVRCSSIDTLDWAGVSEGEKASKQEYEKKGMKTTMSARNKSGVTSSFKVGKNFTNKSSLEWKTTGAKKNASSNLSLVFGTEPDQFNFDLYDIDKENINVIDSVTISGYKDGQLVELLPANIVSMGSAVAYMGNNSFRGILNVNDATSSEGNISISYFVPVDSVVIAFNNASTTAGSNPQQIAVGRLCWCETENEPPVILDENANPTTIIRATTPFNEPLHLCVNVVDDDEVSVSQIVPVQDYGKLATAPAPDPCLIYTPKQDFMGEESFHVTWCDDRTPALCTEVLVIITVLTPDGMLPFIISQAVSPNGDNILDTWLLQGVERYPNNHVRLFNVWGDLVFEQEHYDNELNPWRGESNRGALTGNQRIPDGTYYYIVDLGDGSDLLKGFVMLKR